MKTTNNNHMDSNMQKDFWEILHTDIIASNNKISYEDYYSLIERNFMFSLFFRGCSPLELTSFRNILNIKKYAYVILIDFQKSNKTDNESFNLDDFQLHSFIKKTLSHTYNTIGPLITNRISVLISSDTQTPANVFKKESMALCDTLMKALEGQFNVSMTIGIGSLEKNSSLYSSFINALACLYQKIPGHIVHYQDLEDISANPHFDYVVTEKLLLEAIRLRKPEAYDYFNLIMNWIRPFSDEKKRNKILELLILAKHEIDLDTQNEVRSINYIDHVKELVDLTGEALIEFAFRCFFNITSYVKPQATIDYTNNIVRTTKEYLENHYMDDISLEDMAAQVNISPQYFSKLIKKTTGFNYIDWLSMLRVKKAKELLTNSDLTVKEVCFMVGYKDPNYFSRIFKKRIGITPSEYIKTSSYVSNKN